jgi:hypothetical protein
MGGGRDYFDFSAVMSIAPSLLLNLSVCRQWSELNGSSTYKRFNKS